MLVFIEIIKDNLNQLYFYFIYTYQ